MPAELLTCQCEFREPACRHLATQEDLLCDFCRTTHCNAAIISLVDGAITHLQVKHVKLGYRTEPE